jgi:hypothetical protein
MSSEPKPLASIHVNPLFYLAFYLAVGAWRFCSRFLKPC